MKNKNFLKTYQSRIMPKIKELDLIMKDGEYFIDISELSEAISADESEIEEILDKIKEPYPTKDNVFEIIAQCKSYICRMIVRESMCGSPESYTPFQIAYIYDLSSRRVQEVFEYLNIDKAVPDDLPNIFINIEKD